MTVSGDPGDLGEHQALGAVGAIGGRRVADRKPRVVADDREALVTERVHQRDRVAGLRAGVTLLGFRADRAVKPWSTHWSAPRHGPSPSPPPIEDEYAGLRLSARTPEPWRRLDDGWVEEAIR